MDKKNVIARGGLIPEAISNPPFSPFTKGGMGGIASLPASFLAASARNVTITNNKEELAVCRM